MSCNDAKTHKTTQFLLKFRLRNLIDRWHLVSKFIGHKLPNSNDHLSFCSHDVTNSNIIYVNLMFSCKNCFDFVKKHWINKKCRELLSISIKMWHFCSPLAPLLNTQFVTSHGWKKRHDTGLRPGIRKCKQNCKYIKNLNVTKQKHLKIVGKYFSASNILVMYVKRASCTSVIVPRVRKGR